MFVARSLLSVRPSRPAIWFAAAAAAIRIGFVAYTGRVWEDATITLASARNLWDGIGLVHHAGELTQSFSSPVGLVVQIIGESVNHGLWAARLASLVAAVATILLADRLCTDVGAGTAGRIVLLSYLSMSQAHVFLGMTGMETQMATAYLVGAAYLWTRNVPMRNLGVLAGAGVLFRPEFLLLPLAMFALLPGARARLKFAGWAAVVPAVYAAFNAVVFRSLLPGTAQAKNLYPMIPSSRWSTDGLLDYVRRGWLTILQPFRDYPLVLRAPTKPGILQLVAYVVLALALIGIASGLRRDRRGVIALCFSVLCLYFVYRTSYRMPGYFYWYNVPFTALLFLLVAVGLTRVGAWVRAPRWSSLLTGGVAAVLSIFYVVPNAYSWPIERKIQREIEVGVRDEVGRILSTLIRPGDLLVLEPPGFIGLAIPRVKILDYPGLTSIQARAILKSRPKSQRLMYALVEDARPKWLVLRKSELEWMRSVRPALMAKYEPVRTVSVDEGLRLSHRGLFYFSVDTSFTILQRTVK